MNNELLLILNLLVVYSMVLVWLKLFGKRGLMGFTVFATIAANIEVLILIDAFSMEQTLGNIMFASTFLITDILSEIGSKQEANKAVNLGIVTSISFILVSQMWLLFTPSSNDFAFPAIQTIFSNTPRLMLVSVLVYAISQKLDVIIYHTIWKLTQQRSGSHEKFLWVRNNGSTLISQLINTFLFNFGAFYGVYDLSTVFTIAASGYAIYMVTSLADTPFVYLARKICPKEQ